LTISRKENVMPDVRFSPSIPMSESTSVTFVGTSNLIPPESGGLPSYGVCSYTVPGESGGISPPLSESAVRVGNSVLSAHVPEHAILRDPSEDF
jgi:hypothetical protein